MKIHPIIIGLVALLFTSLASLSMAQGMTIKESTNSNDKETLSLLVGTYTAESESEGIYLYRFNQKTGASQKVSSSNIGNPSFLCFTKHPSYVYTVSEFSNATAGVNATAYQDEAGTFGKTTSTAASTHGKGAEDPCNIWTNGTFVVTANYTGGSLSTFSIEENGVQLKLRQQIQFGKLLDNATSHIHCALPTPDGKFLLVTDLGNDCIYRFTINSKANAQNEEPFLIDRRIVYNGPQGWGPRHFTFSSDGQMMYLINELGGNIVCFRYINGNLLPTQTIAGEEVDAHGSADIHLSPDGHYLYASHRLKNDGISIFKVNKANGSIRKVGYQHTARHPRNFAITPNGKFLLVASRDDHCIEVYLRNKRTGLLQKTSQQIAIPKPVCLQFY